jgi:hypothetical protein
VDVVACFDGKRVDLVRFFGLVPVAGVDPAWCWILKVLNQILCGAAAGSLMSTVSMPSQTSATRTSIGVVKDHPRSYSV